MPYYTGSPEVVVTGNNGSSFPTQPSVAALAGGGFVMTWISGSGATVLAQRFHSDGQPNGAIFTASVTTDGNSEPTVAASPLGGFTIVWTNANTDTYMRIYSSSGTPVGPTAANEVLVAQVTANQQSQPSISYLSDGSFVVGWSDNGRDGSGLGLFARRFNSGGTAISNDFRINAANDGTENDSEIVALPDGGFGVFWTTNSTGPNINLAYQRYNAAGQKVGGEQIIAASPLADFDLQATVLKDGSMAVVWTEIGGDVFNTKLQRFDLNGSGIGLATTLGGSTRVQIAALPDGGYVVARRANSELLGASPDIVLQRFDAASKKVGVEWTTTNLLDPFDDSPTMAVLSDGSFVVGWQANQTQAGGSIKFARFRDVGDFLSDGADRAMATNGADYIEGYAGNDELYGADGDDVIDGGAGADRLVGGAGHDEATYIGSSAAVSLNLAVNIHSGDAAGDTFNSIEQFTLSRFGDRFIGSAADEVVYGLNGDDNLVGGAGNDVIDGGIGDDLLEGGPGADTLIGGIGHDRVSYVRDSQSVVINLSTGERGGAAAGDVYATIEEFALSGFNDRFFGSGGSDMVSGGGGDDLLEGGDGNDVLDGGTGNDILDGGTGPDLLIGGLGDDLYIVDGADQVVEAFGAGNDTVAALTSVALTAGSAIEALVAADEPGTAPLTLIGNEHGQIIRGNAGNNTLNGLGGADVLSGLGGDDFIFGGADNDQLFGQEGADSLDGEAGDDYLDGGSARDILIGGLGADTIIGGTDNDQLYGQDGADSINGQDGDDYVDGGSGRDIVIGGAGADVVIGGGDGDELYGQDGNDSLNGQDGDDYVDGGSGRDFVIGGAGADIVIGGGDGDELYGQDGNDSLNGQDGDDYVDGGSGRDFVIGGAGADLVFGGADGDELYGQDGADNLNGQDGDDYVDGGAGRDTLIGGIGNDILSGGEDDDYFDGQEGNDYLIGGGGNDYVTGGAGNDVLLGNGGADELRGQDGADVFVFGAVGESIVGAMDWVADFSSVQGDKIDLSSIDANASTAGKEAFTFVGTNAFSNKAGELRYAVVNGQAQVFADVNGDGVADLAFIVSAPSLSASDFIGVIGN